MKGLDDSFYKETSAIAHADAFVTLRYRNGAWGLESDVRSWSSYCEAALDFSLLAASTLYHGAVYKLGLPFERDVQVLMGRLKQKGLMD